jgi:uncharacterized protein YegP (UPF0339 family)
MAAKYDVRTSSDSQYYFNLKAANGRVFLTSERYTTKANTLNGVRSVQQKATIVAQFDRRTSKAEIQTVETNAPLPESTTSPIPPSLRRTSPDCSNGLWVV